MSKVESVEWKVEGMSCSNCALSIEKYLNSKDLSNIYVNFAEDLVKFNIPIDNSVEIKEIEAGIEKLGFSVEAETKTERKIDPLLLSIIICSVLTIPLLLSMFFSFPILKNGYFQLALSLPVYLFGLLYFAKSSLNSLKVKVLNMDVLVLLGSSVAFFYSLYGILNNLGSGFLFFETSATIITVILIGNYLEKRTLKQTTDAIESLLKLEVNDVKLITNLKENLWEKKDKSQVKSGDLLAIHSGDLIPLDGIVVKGSGASNESMLTGESEYVYKSENDNVFAGTTLEDGNLVINVNKTGKETTLQKVVALIRKAQQEKPEIQKLVDKISAVFIPLIILLSILCFLLNYFFLDNSLNTSLLRSVAVLVVSCPCALGLATPTALMVGLGKLSNIGFLLNNGNVIESLGKVRNIVFDKTGTLTSGRFQISNAFTNIDTEEFKSAVKSLETYSSHPLAKSLTEILIDVEAMPFEQVEEIKGIGVFGKNELGDSYAVGSYNIAKNLTEDDKHAIYVVKNGKLIGWLDVEDEIRPNVIESVNKLKLKNFTLFLLSGDKLAKTEDFAKKVGIDKFYAEKLPAEKLEIITSIKEKGTTLLIGDGINDAPSLVKADIGVSLGSANDIAINSADAVLLNNDFQNLDKAIKISRLTSKCIKQNLFWAFLYNIIMIPLAFFGILHPMIAAVAMALSSLFVVGNSLRLKYSRIN